jgi:voltage-gated sodium channel
MQNDNKSSIELIPPSSPHASYHMKESHLSVSTEIPFSLATDPNEDDDDTYSLASHVSLSSETDGIDIVGGGESSTKNFTAFVRRQAARVVTNRLFKRTVLGLILTTSILLGIRTIDRIREHSGLLNLIDGTIILMKFFFTFEVLTQVAFYQRRLLHVGWATMDLFVVATSWIPQVDNSILILRGFRLLRALRKASVLKPVRSLVKAWLRLIPKIMALLLLLAMLFYIFAVWLTNLYQDMDKLYAEYDYYEQAEAQVSSTDYFSRLDVSALTLFQIMTAGLPWSTVCEDLGAVYTWACVPITGFVVVSLFFFAVLAVAIACEALSAIKQERIWKPFDVKTASKNKQQSMLDTSVQKQQHEFTETTSPTTTFARGNTISTVDDLHQQEVHRLERKIDDLLATIEKLVRMQRTMQETLKQMTQQTPDDRQPREAHS